MRTRIYPQADSITWLQVHNLFPIITGVIATVGVFNLLSTRVSLQDERLQYTNSKADACLSQLSDIKNRIEVNALDIKGLEAQRSVKGAYIMPQPTPGQGGEKK